MGEKGSIVRYMMWFIILLIIAFVLITFFYFSGYKIIQDYLSKVFI